MELDKNFNIKFAGLRNGNHDFSFEINPAFFEPFIVEDVEESTAFNMTGKAEVFLEKMSTMLIVDIDLTLSWQTDCDTCGEDLVEEIESSNKFYVKFGNEESTDEDVLVLPHNEFEFNVSPFIYEYVITSIPLRKAHEEQDCNQEVLKKLNDLRPNNDGGEQNPMWDQLKNLS